jgi:hypothetical protein
MAGTVHKSYHIGAACVCGRGKWALVVRCCPGGSVGRTGLENLPTHWLQGLSGPGRSLRTFLFAFVVDAAHCVWTGLVWGLLLGLGHQELVWLST